MRPGLVTRLWLSITVLNLAVLLVLGGAVARQMEGLYDFHLTDHMAAQARGLILLYDPDPLAQRDRPWRELETVIGARITLLTAEELVALAAGDPGPVSLPPATARQLLGREMVAFRDKPGSWPIIEPAAGGHAHGGWAGSGAGRAGTGSGGGRHEVFVTGLPLTRDGVVTGALFLSAPITSVNQTIAHFRQILIGTAVALLAGVTLLALFLSRRISRPLLEMEEMAQAMAAGDFHRRVQVRGRDEIGRLGESINRLAAALADTIHQLAEEGARLSGILSSMSDGVILADAGGRVTLLNPPAAVLAREGGIPCPKLPCVGDWSYLERLQMAHLFRQVLAGSAPMAERIRLGSSTYAVRLAPLRNEQGQTWGAVAVWQDVTQEERLEEMRREFIANVSHELRTPISLVQGYVEALEDGFDGSLEERNEILAVIREEMGRMEHLVSDLLDLARLSAGQARLEPEPVALGPLVAHLARKLAPLLEQTGVRIEQAVGGDLPLVLADPDRLEQVLLNLLQNALQHTPAGSTVTVAARAAAGEVTVEVQDQGPGIPPGERELVWERFYRGDPARSRKSGGTGLGLAIVRGIIEAHGGRTWVEDVPDGGCRFCFTLPLAGAGE